MPILEYKGEVVEFDHEPSQEDIDQSIAYINSLPPKMSKGEAFGKGFLKSVLDYSSQWNKATGREGSKTASGLTLDEESQLASTKDMQEAAQQHPWSTVGGAVLGQVGTTLATPGTIVPGVGPITSQVLPRLGVMAGMGLSSTGARKTELMEGDPVKREAAEKAALTGGMTDALLAGILPAGIATGGAGFGSAALQRMGTGASFNALAGTLGDVAQNLDADSNIKQVDPLSWERRKIDVISGGVLGPIMGTTMGKMDLNIKKRAYNKEFEAALKDPELNSFDTKYKDILNAEGFENRLKESLYQNAETQILRFKDEIHRLDEQLKDPNADIDLLVKAKELRQEGIRRAEKILVDRPKQVVPKPTVKIFLNEEDSKYVGGVRNNNIYINKPRLDALWEEGGIANYIEQSPQKLKMISDYFGVSSEQFGSLFKSKDDFINFLIRHEQYHIDHKHADIYPRDSAGKLDLMAKKALEIESEATLNALNTEQLYQLSKLKRLNDRKISDTTRPRDKKIVIPKLLDELAKKEETVRAEQNREWKQAQEEGREPQQIPTVAERIISEEFETNPKDIATTFPNTNIDNKLKNLVNLARTGVGEFFNHYFAGTQKALVHFDSPVIQHSWSVIKHAYDSSLNLRHMLLDGIPDKTQWLADGKGFKRQQGSTSVRQMLQKSTDHDVASVLEVFEMGYGRLDYDINLLKNGSKLTEHQKALYNTLSTMYKRLHKVAIDHANKLNKKKIIPEVLGWYPAVRRGDFGVNIRMPGKNLVSSLDPTKGIDLTNIVYTEFFTSKKQAQDFITFINKNRGTSEISLEMMDLSKIKEEDRINIAELLIEAQRRLQENNTTLDAETIAQSMKELADQYTIRGGTLGQHHQYRVNIPGYAGSSIFINKNAAGKAWKKSIISSVEDYTRTMFKMEVGTRLDQIVTDPRMDSRPNLKRAVSFMENYALNKNFVLDDLPTVRKALNNSQYLISGGKPVEMGWGNKVLGFINHATYIDLLMSRASFHVGQYAQFLWTIREGMKIDPGKTAQTFGTAFKHIIQYHSKGWKALPKDVVDFFFYGTQQRPDSFGPQFVTDVDSFFKESHQFNPGKLEKTAKIVTLETPASFADSWSRFASAMWLYELYKTKGLKGEKLYQTVIDAVDTNMVRYEKQNKPPMFAELGAIGQMASPMSTFPRAALGNFIADVRYFLRNPKGKKVDWIIDALPAMSTIAISSILVGVPGAIVFGEYELFKTLYNIVAGKRGWQPLPSLSDIILNNTGNDETPPSRFKEEFIRHGGISAATLLLDPTEQGMDIGQSNRYRTFLDGMGKAETDLMDLAPGIGWFMDQIGYNTTLIQKWTGDLKVSDADYRNAFLGSILATPGALFDAGADMLHFDALNRKIDPDKKGSMFDKQTNLDILAMGLGTKTLDKATFKEKVRDVDLYEKAQGESRSKLLEHLVDIIGKDPVKEKLILDKLIELRVSPDEIRQKLLNEVWGRNVPQGLRQFVSRSGKMSPAQQRFYETYTKLYGQNPLIENTQ